MEAYYSDGRGRYGTGESYDWFYKYEDEDVEILSSSDGLWTYTFADEGIEILRYNGNQTDVIVPARIDGSPVISLDSTFDGFYELKRAVVPEGVTSIAGAFYGCEQLEDVTLPASIIDMAYAFNCCLSLEQLAVPPNARIFSSAFVGTKLDRFVFPQSAADISSAFVGSEYLKSVFVPGNVTDMQEAFADCEVLTQVVIEEGVTRLGKWAFYNCPQLLNLTIPESVAELESMSVGFVEVRQYTNPSKTGYKINGREVIPGFIINGVTGSAAEKYANENGIEFSPIHF